MTSRPSNYEEDGKPRFQHVGTGHYPAPNSGMFSNVKRHNNGNERDKDLHMLARSANASPVSDLFGGGHEYGAHYQKELRLNVSPGKEEGHGDNREEFVAKGEVSFGNRGKPEKGMDNSEKGERVGEENPRKMPPACAMT